MTSDPDDDALTWDGDDGAARPKRDRAAAARTTPPVGDASLPDGWNAVGRGSDAITHRPDADVADIDERGAESLDETRPPLSTAMLLTLGVVGGVYLLYSVGWVVGGLRLKPLANFFVADAMFIPWFVLAVAAPALWFVASLVLTRGRAGWMRVGALVLGVVLLVPWPFVTVGAIGA
ncbi:hypothetical protein [Microbacterium sp. NPDC089695]|uniref:hypothetical protein n=1 Tax=Microbacterium sp. NPDC089695 TaxID=3364198 RepID=UPI00380B8EEF